MATIDEVYENVRAARAEGSDALAALALRYGADAVGWMIRHDAMRRELLDAERGMDEAREERDSLRSERDAMQAELKSARESSAEARAEACDAGWQLDSERGARAELARVEAERDEARAERDALRHERDAAQHSTEEARQQCERALDAAAVCARQRDEARSRASMLAQDLARAMEERDRAVQDRARIAMEERDRAVQDRARIAMEERDRAVQEREAFSLRLSAAEHARDEARAERDASDERWATVCRECDVALAERDAALARVQALHAELVAIRADFGHQRDITEDAIRERDEARAERDAALARPCVGHPTPKERAAHIDAGGEWVMVWRQPDGEWRCYSTSEHSNTVADTHYIPARNGLPCAWPVPSAEVTP